MRVESKFLASPAARRLGGLAAAAAIVLLVSCGKGGDGERGAAASLPQVTSEKALAPLEETYAALQEAVFENPEDTVSRVYLARHYIRAADAVRTEDEQIVFFAMADREAGIALGLAPSDRNVRRLYGETAILNGYYRRAVRIYEGLVYEDTEGLNAEDAAILFGLYFLDRNVDRGILFFRTKLRRAPNDKETRYLLALLHALSEDRREAVGHLRILADDPSTPKNILLISRKLIMDIDR